MDLEKLIDQLAKLENSARDLLESKPEAGKALTETTAFEPRTDILSVQVLNKTSAEDPALPGLVLQQLSPFFVGGLLLQRRAWRGENQWCLTEYLLHGQHHTLAPQMQKDLSRFVQTLPVDTVRRAPAAALLDQLPLKLPINARETFAYLMVPTPETAYIWFSQTAELWNEGNMRHTLNLINQAFTP
ncbi:MAG: hypothetical protein AB7N80_10600 [Bdellovibrionales bacterium]